MKKKTPITYYGGKQSMLKHILPLIPKHNLYTECFCGGAAVFWGKEPSKVEVINDLNGEVVNFYRQVKSKYKELNVIIKGTLHSRKEYTDAKVIYDNPHLFDDVRRAWAFWMLTQQGFLSRVGSWGYDKKTDKIATSLANKKIMFTDEVAARLERTQIECNDAVKVILSRDSESAFHYVDPPYINTNLGHYKGYNLEDYIRLLNALEKVEGKFMLSSFLTDILDEYTTRNGWHTLSFEKQLSASRKGKKKLEVLTMNYKI